MGQTLLSHCRKAIRQWRYPAEFRIAAQPLGEELAQLEKLLAGLAAPPAPPPPVAGSPPTLDPAAVSALDDEAFIADLATRLWRVRQSLLRAGAAEPVEGADRGFRHLERLISHLDQAGVRIVDKTGSFYDPGMVMQVVSSEPMDGIGREIIKETVKPAVYRGERLIQTPQVVVGVPTPVATS